jgi:hypothetical protein
MTHGLYFLKVELNYLKDHTFNTRLTDAQKWRYVQLNMLAKELNEGGAFICHGKELSLADIAWHLHLDVDLLQTDMDAIKGIGLICENGHGPVLARFVKEQETPRTDKERKDDQRTRDTVETHANHEPVTTRDTESESESDIESDIESESEGESSVKEIVQQPTDDDRSLTDRKRLICTHAGIPPKYANSIIDNHNAQITPADILAELARNYSRKGKVKNPGYITGMNLSKISPEKAAAEWYDQARWRRYLPGALKSKLGLVSQSEPEGLDTLLDVTTRNTETEKPHVLTIVEIAWQNALEQLRQDMPKASYNKYLKPTHALYVLDDKFVVQVETLDAAEWLESRAAITASRLLAGIMNRDVTVRFTSQKETPA